ncbi:hypothetical protein VNI00_010208 [Paramarasmius palmivorus]|uniref:Cytochrome P450 n=1 Tax=Paramarasmius palmivorus TaxID=297713 RepID=A0AAW0CJJ4_9AGAR
MGLTYVDIGAAGVALSSFLLLYILNRRKRLDFLNGPEGEGYLFGVEYLLRTEQHVGDLTFRWIESFGPTYRQPGSFGQPKLITADPRAIHHILHAKVNEYPEARDVRRILELIFGRGVLWAVGEEHRKHRRVLSPAFSINHLKSFGMLFEEHVAKLSEKWNVELAKEVEMFDVIPWLQKVTLDIIGESSFNYHFDALENKPNELTKALKDLDELHAASPSRAQVLAVCMLQYIPPWLSAWQNQHFPTPVEKIAKRYLELSNEKAREVMHDSGLSFELSSEVEELLLTGKERDVLSVLVKANRAEDPRKRLTEDEVLSQMSTLIQAGHHTTGYSMAWILYELSRHPEDQDRVYREVKERSDHGYDSLEWLGCCVKEALRLHPVLSILFRESAVYDSIPLEIPVIGSSGQEVTEVPVIPGQRIIIDIASCNRLESVWGPDANEWNPARFLKENDLQRDTSVGMTGNILSFSGGPKGCVGFRFALMEIHALLGGLIERFEFRVPNGMEFRRANMGMMLPVSEIEGEEVCPGLILDVKARV